MALLFWDASALMKRYFIELGSDTVDALFDKVAARDMATTPWAYIETYASLLRKMNGGAIDLPTFTTAVTSLQAEVVDDPDFRLLPNDETSIFASISLIRRHNLNATDAAILSMLLGYVQALPLPRSCILVAADKRLIRAAAGEGLTTLNPAELPVADVPTLLANL
jgi:predicted nucleic acid-binding protein